MKEVGIEPGGELVVDTGHVVAFTEHVQYSVGKVGGLGSLIAGGEGLVMKFTGSGRIWIQTRTLASFMDKLAPFLPSPKS